MVRIRRVIIVGTTLHGPDMIPLEWRPPARAPFAVSGVVIVTSHTISRTRARIFSTVPLFSLPYPTF